MEIYRKQLLDHFVDNLSRQYGDYANTHGIAEDSMEQLISYMIDHDLIPSSAIKRFTIRHEFHSLTPYKKNKTEIVRALSDKFNISERSIWAILRTSR